MFIGSKGWKLLGILLFLPLLLALLACPGPPGPAGPPGPPGPPGEPARAGALIITPLTGKAAAIITIIGAGFLPDEEIEIILITPEGIHGLGTFVVEKVIANAFGAFKVASGIPIGTSPGVYTVKATGNKGTIATSPLEVVK